MSRSAHKDDKERYPTYSITVRAANKDKGIEEKVVTKKMPKFIDGGPKDFLDWVYHFDHLASLKHWNAEDKFLNTTILLEGDLREAFADAAITDEDVRMDEEFTRALRKASIVVLPVDYSEKLQAELWEIRNPRTESLAEYNKRFRALVRMEYTLARLNENSPMCEDALCRLYKRGLPYEWQNKYDASGHVYTTVAAFVPFFERIEQGEQRLHRAGSQDKGWRRDCCCWRCLVQGFFLADVADGCCCCYCCHCDSRCCCCYCGARDCESCHDGCNKYCTFHRTTTHNTADCRALRQDNQQEEHQQAEQRRRPRAAQPPQQRQRTRVVQHQTEGSSSDDEYLFVGLNASPTSSPPPMRVMIKLEAGKDRFRDLLDSGCSRSIVSSAFMKLLQQQQGATLESSKVSFKLVKGNTKSIGATTVRFRIPQLKRDSVIIHKFEVLPTLPGDMTIGRDLMGALGLVIDFMNGRITWDGSELVVRTTEHGPAEQDNANDEATFDEDDELCAGDDCATTPEDLLPQHLEAALEHCYLKLLEEYADLYGGRLGRIRLDDYLLPLRADYTSSHARPYSVPRSQEEAARREIQKLLEEDVIEQIYGSEAAAPAFFLVKPNGSLRLLVDFRELNKFLRRSPYYVPKIREILLRLGKAKCMSTLDANMGYFARRLARQSRAATAFCLPFGKFQFKRLPMDISTAPDEYQACMERILGDLDFVIVYLDDILIFSENPVEHLEHLRIVFDRLRQYVVTLNGKKCHILRDRVGYLGFTLTAEGIQPQMKKVEVIQQIAEPCNKRELRRFLGMIAYYRGMVPNNSVLTARLNRLTSKTCKFTWTPEDSAAFRSIKEALTRSVWLAFSDYSRRFHVFVDASGHKIGDVIVQGRKIIACFSRAMTNTQKKYSTLEWELLSVVEILKEYRTMLLGFPVVIHTDHKNVLFPRETSLRVKRWKLLLEDYRLEVVYIPGSQNIGADAFSRLLYDFVKQASEEELCAVEEEAVPIPGADMQYHTMSVFWWPGMEKDVTDFVKACNDCKRAKLHGGKQNNGHLPPTPVANTDRPFDVVHVDLLGPISGDCYCLTAIAQQFRWLEVIIQRGKTSATTAISFERVWLCRYPRPERVVHDLGPEFTGDEFQLLLKSMAIEDKPITAKKPQANAICERVHLELMNILRVRPDLHDRLQTALDYAAVAKSIH